MANVFIKVLLVFIVVSSLVYVAWFLPNISSTSTQVALTQTSVTNIPGSEIVQTTIVPTDGSTPTVLTTTTEIPITSTTPMTQTTTTSPVTTTMVTIIDTPVPTSTTTFLPTTTTTTTTTTTPAPTTTPSANLLAAQASACRGSGYYWYVNGGYCDFSKNPDGSQPLCSTIPGSWSNTNNRCISNVEANCTSTNNFWKNGTCDLTKDTGGNILPAYACANTGNFWSNGTCDLTKDTSGNWLPLYSCQNAGNYWTGALCDNTKDTSGNLLPVYSRYANKPAGTPGIMYLTSVNGIPTWTTVVAESKFYNYNSNTQRFSESNILGIGPVSNTVLSQSSSDKTQLVFTNFSASDPKQVILLSQNTNGTYKMMISTTGNTFIMDTTTSAPAGTPWRFIVTSGGQPAVGSPLILYTFGNDFYKL